MMRIAISLLSIMLLLLLGITGEELLNQVHPSSLVARGYELPPATSFVVRNYPLNAGHFSLSLTPFMVLIAGAAVLSLVRRTRPEAFLYAFVTIWLIAGIYISLFVFVLLVPFHLLLMEMSDTPSPFLIVVRAVDVFLVGCLVLFCLRSLRGRGKAKQGDRGDGK